MVLFNHNQAMEWHRMTAGRGKRGYGKAGSRSRAQQEAALTSAKQLLDSLDGTHVCFTDGACRGNPGPAGAGAFIQLDDGRELEGSLTLGHATNNIAELAAIDLALELLAGAGIPDNAPTAILTDSSYVHGVLTKGWKAKANATQIAAIRARLAGRPHTALYWVAGHAGIEGNERADALAQTGIDEG